MNRIYLKTPLKKAFLIPFVTLTLTLATVSNVQADTISWSVDSPSDSYNRPDLNPNYDIEEVSVAIWDNDPDWIYFYLWFKNVPTAGMFNDGNGSWAAVRIDTDLDDDDDYRLTISQTQLKTDRSSVDGYVYSFDAETRLTCEVNVFTNIEEGRKYVGFTFKRSCINLRNSFGVTGYSDYISNDSTSFDYAPDRSFVVTLPGGTPPSTSSGGSTSTSRGTSLPLPGNVSNKSTEALNYSVAPRDLTALSKSLLPSVVTIACAGGKGTGWAGEVSLSPSLTSNGYKSYLFTNHHVIEDCISSKKLSVTLSSGEVIPGELIAWDESKDVAGVAVKSVVPPMQWIGKAPEQGWWVGVLGSPLGASNVLTTGIVSSVNSSAKQFTMTAAINPGNSGGPVFDSTGRVLGLATAKRLLSTGELAEGFGIAHGVPLLCTSVIDCVIESDPWNAIPKNKEAPSAEELAAVAQAKAEAEAKSRAEAEAKAKAESETLIKSQKGVLCKDFNGDLQQTLLKLKLAIATYPKSSVALSAIQSLVPSELDCNSINIEMFDSDLITQRKLLSTFQSAVDNAVITAEKATKNPSKTITCIKGSQIKKVTAANPKCPRGYKKK